MFRLLFLGDVVGSTGRKAIKENLPRLIGEFRPDVILANGENIAAGKGITRDLAKELFGMGVHLITMGNHTWDKKEVFDFIDEERRIIRPANFPENNPGRGFAELKIKGETLTVINLQGRVFLPAIDCPFQIVDKILKNVNTKFVIVDFHAEATSEKIAMGWHLDGKVSAVIGTHTHVQTNDARILPAGTAYITDVGMNGSRDGVLGIDKEAVLHKFKTQLPVKFNVDEGKYQVNAVCIDFDNKGKATKIQTLAVYE